MFSSYFINLFLRNSSALFLRSPFLTLLLLHARAGNDKLATPQQLAILSRQTSSDINPTIMQNSFINELMANTIYLLLLSE
jgi:hypothetical protein